MVYSSQGSKILASELDFGYYIFDEMEQAWLGQSKMWDLNFIFRDIETPEEFLGSQTLWTTPTRKSL